MVVNFVCHPLSDGHPYNGRSIGWCSVGEGRFFVAPYLSTVKEKVVKVFPEASFTEGPCLEPEEAEALGVRFELSTF